MSTVINVPWATGKVNHKDYFWEMVLFFSFPRVVLQILEPTSMLNKQGWKCETIDALS